MFSVLCSGTSGAPYKYLWYNDINLLANSATTLSRFDRPCLLTSECRFLVRMSSRLHVPTIQAMATKSTACRRYGGLCRRFWREIDNNGRQSRMRQLVVVDHVANSVDFVESGWFLSPEFPTSFRLCCQCVRGQSDAVDFVDFQQSRPCWIRPCLQCVGGLPGFRFSK